MFCLGRRLYGSAGGGGAGGGVGVEEEAERGVGVAVVVYVPGWCVSRDRMSVVLQDVSLRRLLDDMASGDLREQLKASVNPTMNECGL